MAECQAQKKNKKGKKKPELNAAPVIMSTNTDTKLSTDESSSNDHQFLSDKLNIKTSENIEVTVVNDKKQESVDESSNKKKKKSKKKSKDTLKEADVENTDSKSLLNFSKNGIQLVNHPEISVTFTGSSQPVDNESQLVREKDPPSEEKEKLNNSNGNTTSKKKKKKKKNGNNTPSVSAVTNEATYATPTYTKVVTSDNTCVLVVNNENLSVSTKSLGNSDEKKVKISESNINFSVPTEKQLSDVLFPKTFTSDSTVKLGDSVSIFPVLTDVNDNMPDQNSNVKVETNLNLETKSEITTVVLSKKIDDLPEKENIDDSKLTKAQLKAERRAKQEAQRAAKLAKTTAKTDPNSQNLGQNNNSNTVKEKEKSVSKEKIGSTIPDSVAEKSSDKTSAERDALRKVRLFSHLPQHRQFDINAKIHPAILELGSQYNKGIICGSNARCVALLSTLREIIKNYTHHPDKSFSRDLESSIQIYLNFLNTCRPLSVSVTNAVKFLKHQINHIPSEMDVDKAKERLCKFINDFVNEEILLAKEAIGNSASAKIVDGDVILVFAHSSLVKYVLCKAHNENKIFRVIVTDSRPKLEGSEMLRYLTKQGLNCSYVPVNTLTYVMKEVSKVIIGAHALLSNGCVMSRVGSKQIARVASSYSVPVLVCCETYKFCERVLTDSFVHNELGEPNDISTSTLVSNDSLKNWHEMSSLLLLNLLYDVTPADLISMVITEKGVLPCTSVPVVLRVRYAGLHE